MNVEIRNVADQGTLKKERIILRVLREDDIGNYVIFDTTFTQDGRVSNKVRHAFWFPDEIIQPGDLVVLYSKSGSYFARENKDGSKTHFFYWNLETTVWNKDSDCAVLLQVSNWKAKDVFEN